ncbi:hypothetical protein [Deinococcus multiflagellatus]|uniref:Uncharacterized protein n=1 Tax=Deinococcus multiflagellatus TaxID=1656887 RepID=A0ABW1ZUG9_9DEIO|nr:hypothetical protein [Deinococcus multiflagellatus]MBZ9715494.1 hypothetical protein [Deinococcus multiflagellatus]
MTLRDDPELQALRREAQGEVQANAGLMFRHRGTFEHTQGGRTTPYLCTFSVKDPVKGNRDEVAAAEAFATAEQVPFRDVRLLTVNPADQRPPKGSFLREPWDGGRLEVRSWSQASDFTGLRRALCILRR